MASDRPCGTEKIVCIRTPAISYFIRGPGYFRPVPPGLKSFLLIVRTIICRIRGFP
ncbi:Uncharacterized protein dnm_033260 [Desulfonema magnum]|uniref:Uncharacterized protein n=1 Tax=Desulfonema magnum TaxID=45655 RepID=A0A975GMU3_9BACT|nr:Uncharacterized protein dnm_033260 [Desulfonema magnum]